MSPATQSAAHDPALERALREFEALAGQLPDAVLTRAARRRAAAELRRLGWPSSRDEQWRYLNLRAFEHLTGFAPAALARSTPAPQGLAALPPALPGLTRILFVDGLRVPQEASADAGAPAAPGASALPTAGAGAAVPFPAEPAWSAGQRLALLNDLFAQDTAALRIRGDAAVELLFVRSAHAPQAAVYPRLRIELASDARLTLVERHLQTGPASVGHGLISAATLVEVGRGAQLIHYRVQQYGRGALLADALIARVHEQASYELRHLALGAAQARTGVRIHLVGRGARFGWQSIAIGHGEQVHDTTLEVEHAAAATRTEELFRGIAEERARLAFSAHIHIQSAAPGAQARQSLRGLIEGAASEIDLRPRLQIDTDEVSAQHGATTGRLDEQLLFYLLARGLDRQTARALLKWAFLGDVLRAIELPTLRAQIEAAAAGQLQDVLAVGALPAHTDPVEDAS